MAAEDVVAGCVRWLRADPAVTAQVGTDPDGGPWIVQDENPDRDDVDGATVLVVTYLGPGGSGRSGSFEQVRLQVEFWTDPGRDTEGLLHAPAEGRQRMVDAYTAVDRRLHRPQGGTQRWGPVLTTDCERQSGLTPYQVPGTDGLWRGTAVYAVGLG